MGVVLVQDKETDSDGKTQVSSISESGTTSLATGTSTVGNSISVSEPEAVTTGGEEGTVCGGEAGNPSVTSIATGIGTAVWIA